MQKNCDKFTFGTKAETLHKLRGFISKAKIANSYYFKVEQWQKRKEFVLKNITNQFVNEKLAVRSSASDEDNANMSMAGVYMSCLNISSGDATALQRAIDTVVNSYKGMGKDQVLVQKMVDNIAVSGVITTHVLQNGAPYYVINYDDESGKTDTITGGIGVNKTVMISRNAPKEIIKSERVLQWLDFVKELEGLCGHVPLDIEFAQDHDGKLFLLQVRKIAVEKKWNQTILERIYKIQADIEDTINKYSLSRPCVVGKRTILGEMPDWNPVELIGTSPRPLASSLFRQLITRDVWRMARGMMGYRNPEGQELMVMIGGRPYIDVRNSFNSFLPNTLDNKIASKLIDAWLDWLDNHPELHDKVEFEVAQTIVDFNFNETFRSRYSGILTDSEFGSFKVELLKLTNVCLDISNNGTLQRALRKVSELEKKQDERSIQQNICGLVSIKKLLDECISLGTLPFSIIARHAFIAEALLRSVVARDAITEDRLAEFKSSLLTVSGSMALDLKKVYDLEMSRGAFINKYGHLRPGTYDILSLRYDQRSDLFNECSLPPRYECPAKFQITDKEDSSINKLLCEAGISNLLDAHQLFAYAKVAIIGREHSKYVFTKTLSNIIELIARYGEQMDLSRDDMSYISLDNLLELFNAPNLRDNYNYLKKVSMEGRRVFEMNFGLQLSHIIRDRRDIYIIPLHRSAPNFVTDKKIEGTPIFIDNRMNSFTNLSEKIVCIENADPGFDWIFTRGIAGLITKYGGANSHMAIRCAEFGLPAAIGCGEQIFERLFTAGKIELNCANKIIRPLFLYE